MTERLTQDYWNKFENRSAADYHYVLTLEEITISNPYILDEQYIGAATTTPAPQITGTGAAAKETSFPSVIFFFMVLIMAWRFRKRT